MIDSAVLLQVQGLGVAYAGALALSDIDLELRAGDRLGLVGETGSGKSTLALALIGMLPRGGEVVAGDISFRGQTMAALNERGWRRLRGREIALVYQDAGAALDPIRPVGRQIEEAVRIHAPGSKAYLRARASEALEQVGIASSRSSAYPHELSGGMRQRVAIAMALVHRPRLVIADEPTSALDVTTQAQVLRLLDELVAEVGASLILVSHDLGIVAEFCKTTAVMYAGRFAEIGLTRDLFRNPSHPYTAGLLRCVAGLGDVSLRRLPTIGGSPQSARSLVAGCPFEPRCDNPARDDRCRTVTPELCPAGATRAACLYPLAERKEHAL